MSGGAIAAPIVYDTEANPIDVHSSFNTLPNGQNMAGINPTVLTANVNSASTTPTAAGLLGAATGASDNSGVTNAQLDGTVYFRYEIFSEPSADWRKSGSQFGIPLDRVMDSMQLRMAHRHDRDQVHQVISASWKAMSLGMVITLLRPIQWVPMRLLRPTVWVQEPRFKLILTVSVRLRQGVHIPSSLA